MLSLVFCGAKIAIYYLILTLNKIKQLYICLIYTDISVCKDGFAVSS